MFLSLLYPSLSPSPGTHRPVVALPRTVSLRVTTSRGRGHGPPGPPLQLPLSLTLQMNLIKINLSTSVSVYIAPYLPLPLSPSPSLPPSLCSAPAFAAAIGLSFAHEDPRWLVVRRRYDDAHAVFTVRKNPGVFSFLHPMSAVLGYFRSSPPRWRSRNKARRHAS